jgi:hypothetical protein
MTDQNYLLLLMLPLVLVGFSALELYLSLGTLDRLVFFAGVIILIATGCSVLFYIYSPWARTRRKRIETLRELPDSILRKTESSIFMGEETDLEAKIYLADSIRTRHVHILGATGSGKTESVIFNFLRQDVDRGLGAIVLDAKGDNSFISEISSWIPSDRLAVFDLGSGNSEGYNPLCAGTPLEAAQRLFASLTWSEEYYKSKALTALQRIFQVHFEMNDRNPTLTEISGYLASPDIYSAFVNSEDLPASLANKDFQDLLGLRDQVRSLTMGHLEKTLSPKPGVQQIDLNQAANGHVIYFRLQSLMSPQLVTVVGKLIINHLAYLAGSAHRNESNRTSKSMTPVYFDEFASFACPEFADLISKARSAGFALHFSHQSIGDVIEISPGFLNRITDNAATKIVMRINDPDSAEFFARCFGTRQVQKTTQRITNAKNIDSAEILGEGTTRDAHQFRASPDLFKTLPTGVGAVLIAHGQATPHGASSVFTVRFPELRGRTI